MSYAALDYWYANMPVPVQDFRPSDGTALQKYLFDRIVAAIENNVGNWAYMAWNPGGSNDQSLFDDTLTLTEPNGDSNRPVLGALVAAIDSGRPVVLGLQSGDSKTGNHQVVAYGYDLGDYTGDLGPSAQNVRIFVYDPNHENHMRTLVPNPADRSWSEPKVNVKDDPDTNRWRTFFVDNQYRPATPPVVPQPSWPNDGYIHALKVWAQTGEDDLRGGSDDVNLTIEMIDGSTIPLGPINGGNYWQSNYDQTVLMPLPRPVRQADILDIRLDDTFGGGTGGDNWSMSKIIVSRIVSDIDAPGRIAQAAAKYFTGSDRTLFLPILPPPALPPVAITSVVPDSGWVDGGDAITVYGSNFDINDDVVILVGGRKATNVSCTPTSCRATTPAGVGDALVDVIVNGQRPLGFGPIFHYGPTITALSEHKGAADDTVIIQGIGLVPLPGRSLSVSFGDFPVVYPNCYPGPECTVTVPPGAGTVVAHVTVEGHRSPIVPAAVFSYDGPVITAVLPSSGPIGGWTDVDILGSGFDANNDGQMKLYFGGTPVTNLLCVSSTWCVASSPPVSQPGVVQLSFDANGLSGAQSATNFFTYMPAPRIVSLTGGAVTFDGVTTVNATVLLTCSDPSVLAPTSVVVPAGQMTAPLNLRWSHPAQTETVTLTASYQGSVATTLVTLSPPALSMGLGASTLAYGAGTYVSISLPSAAPVGGAVVNVSSSDPGDLAVPATVTVPAGASGASFDVTSLYAGTTPQEIAVVARYAGQAASAALEVSLSGVVDDGGGGGRGGGGGGGCKGADCCKKGTTCQ